MPATPYIWVCCAQRHKAASLRRHPGQRPCHKASAISPAPVRETPRRTNAYRPRHCLVPPATRVRNAPRHATSRARPWRSAATSCAGGATTSASPSHNTVAGVSAVTPSIASARLNASDAIVGLFRAKAKRDWVLSSADDLTGNHCKMALVLAVSAADIAAIKPNNDGPSSHAAPAPPS